MTEFSGYTALALANDITELVIAETQKCPDQQSGRGRGKISGPSLPQELCFCTNGLGQGCLLLQSPTSCFDGTWNV